ncbi:MAG: hypothetical protein ACXWR0_04995 [Bdellovibrio sp.]
MDAVTRKQKHPDRVTLAPDALNKLSQWVDQLYKKNPGVKATRSDLVAWLIEVHAEDLSLSELNSLEEKFFDSVKYAKWAVKAIIEAKARGEVLNLKLIVAPGTSPSQNDSKQLKKRKKATVVQEPESSEPSAQSSFQSENKDNKDKSTWPVGN